MTAPGGGGPRFLDEADEALLLRIARDSLDTYVRSRIRISPHAYALTPAAMGDHGAFVTLRIEGALRGCVGHTTNRQPLAESVCHSAIHAAVHDPRFPPVNADELARIRIEISALGQGAAADTPFIPVADPGEIRIGRDGVMVRGPGGSSGLLLPQVASGRGWDTAAFLGAVCQKAGLPPLAWKEPGVEMYRFTAQCFAEPGYRAAPE